MADLTPEIIFGGGSLGARSLADAEEVFAVLQKHRVKAIDTAYVYPNNETLLGRHQAAERFSIHTKAQAFTGAAVSKQAIWTSIEKSLKDLKVDSVDLYSLHAPDPHTPIEETLSAIQEIYAAGKFKCFGLSNFMPQDVQKIYDIQAAAKSILPTVFQGNYNAVSRHVEDDLFPVLRKLGISFYAYSPIAGSFFLQDPIRLQADNGQGRFAAKAGPGLMYKRLYCKESLINALFVWADIAREAGVTKAALAYRWIAHHSALKKEYGDGFTIGCSKVSQLDETCTAIEAGPLHPDIAKRVDDIWGTVKHEAPRDNWHDYLAHNSLF